MNMREERMRAVLQDLARRQKRAASNMNKEELLRELVSAKVAHHKDIEEQTVDESVDELALRRTEELREEILNRMSH